MDGRQVAADYHERTKHHFDRLARSLGHLDWATQPDPFRRYAGAELIHLPFAAGDDGFPYEHLYSAGPRTPAALGVESIGALFEYSLALSAWKEYRGSRWALRINPSSGNLHPTEGYLIAPALGSPPRGRGGSDECSPRGRGGSDGGLLDRPGVYHYAPRAHGIERRCAIGDDVWRALSAGFPADTCFVGLTSIHWREAWKYGERAYRYCQHDVGHAIATVALSARLLGWRATWLNGLSDADVSSLLGLDRGADFGDAEREHPDLLMALVPGDDDVPRSLPDAAMGAVSGGTWVGRANRLSSSHVDWPLIDDVAAACVKERGGAFASHTATEAGDTCLPDSEDESPSPPPTAREVIHKRRSAVAMDGRTGITRHALYSVMARVMPRYHAAPWCALGPPTCVHLLLFVHRVQDVEPGLYFLARDPSELDALRAATRSQFEWSPPPQCPDDLPLRCLMRGDARRVATQVSCGQDIAGEGAFAVGMLARFTPSIQQHGAWFYRRLFWETGVIGQVLYLEAEAMGIGSTGIGCFFDDPVHDLLGLTDTTHQSLYHFTVGGRVEDSRLTTLPPYDRTPV